MKPTKEQEEEFWKCFGWGYAPGLGLISPDGEDIVPPIDLNNLFKYALPMLLFFKVLFDHVETSCDYYVTLTDFYLAKPCRVYKAKDKDPALALFWAIYEVVKEGK